MRMNFLKILAMRLIIKAKSIKPKKRVVITTKSPQKLDGSTWGTPPRSILMLQISEPGILEKASLSPSINQMETAEAKAKRKKVVK